MRVLIIDWFNLVKRYTYTYNLEDMDPGEIIDTLTTSILNRVCDCIYQTKPDLMYICSDSGFNKRASAVIDGYKANRKRAKSMTDEQKEKSYIEYLKNVAKTLPIPFIEVEDTEADMIIMNLVKWLKKIDDTIDITIASADSDMLQLLDDHVKIYDWYKGDITIDNWYIKHEKHGEYFNVRNYVVGKSIVGDTSDNVTGVHGWGWKKVTKLFTMLDKYYNKSVVVETVNALMNLIYELLTSDINIDKKDEKFLESTLEMLTENKLFVSTNLTIIDLSFLETPYRFQILSAIERLTFGEKLQFNRTEFLKLLKLDRYGRDEEYYKILAKNSKASTIFFYMAKKSNISVNMLRNKKNR